MSFIQQGRLLAIRFFSRILPVKTPADNPAKVSIPVFLDFLKKSNAVDEQIHIRPLFPRNVILGIKKSRNEHERCSCIKLSIVKSISVIFCIIVCLLSWIYYKSLKIKRDADKTCISFLMPLTGLEPVRILLRGILSPLCLPIPPQRHNNITR